MLICRPGMTSVVGIFTGDAVFIQGIYGALRGWANSSRGAVAYMLAESAKHFNVVSEVGCPSAPPKLQYSFSRPHAPPICHRRLLHSEAATLSHAPPIYHRCLLHSEAATL